MSINKEAKAAYDREYRKNNRAMLKAKKKAYYAKVGPLRRDKEREERKKRMPLHIEYCRRPEYKAWKKEYDKKRREAKFGDFKDAHAVLMALVKEIHRQMPDRFERYAQAQRHAWNPLNQQRRKQRHGNIDFDFDSF